VSTFVASGWLVAVAAPAGAAGPQLPATGHAQVVAQGAATFVVVSQGALITSGADALPRAHLGAGEAANLPAGATTSLLAADGVAANYQRQLQRVLDDGYRRRRRR